MATHSCFFIESTVCVSGQAHGVELSMDRMSQPTCWSFVSNARLCWSIFIWFEKHAMKILRFVGRRALRFVGRRVFYVLLAVIIEDLCPCDVLLVKIYLKEELSCP